MSEEPKNQESQLKTGPNWAVVFLAVAIGLSLIVQVRLILKTDKLENRIEAVEGMFAK